jgi:hypothetical protein
LAVIDRTSNYSRVALNHFRAQRVFLVRTLHRALPWSLAISCFGM